MNGKSINELNINLGYCKTKDIVNFNTLNLCRISVTAHRNGHAYSTTASDNQGDCDAAYAAAYTNSMLAADLFGDY